MDMDRPDHLAVVVSQRGGHGADPGRDLVVRPGVAVQPHAPDALPDQGHVGDRRGREALQRSGEDALDLRRGHVGEDDQAGRDRMHRQPSAGPVADPDGVRAVLLVDVMHQGPIREGQPGGLADQAGESDEVGPGYRDQAACRPDAGSEGDQPAADPIVGAVGHLLDRTLGPQRRQQPRDGALRQADPVGHLGHPERPAAERPEDGEGSFDGLDSGHGRLQGLG